jgi:mono/diheme cytochrome c family protein
VRLERSSLPRPYLLAGALLSVLVVFAGCSQQMAKQPKYLPLSPSSFFPDGRSARPLVEGTVPHGSVAEDYLNVPKDSNAFPFPVTEEILVRGRDRFNIYCSVCHGLLGDGDGMIVRRGFRRPPSYHIVRLRQAPVGHFYDVITNGFGAMPDYAAQIPPRDRWAIIAYIRALQLSQNVPVEELPAEGRRQLGAEGQR